MFVTRLNHTTIEYNWCLDSVMPSSNEHGMFKQSCDRWPRLMEDD